VAAAIRGVGFPSLTIVRPALIGGDRDEFRPAAFVAMRGLRLAEPRLPRRYRVGPQERIASVLLKAAVTAPPGEHLIKSDTIVKGAT